MSNLESSVFVQLTPPVAEAAAVELPAEPGWREMALELYAQGLTLADIARRLKRHSNTVSALLREEGLRQPTVPDRSWHEPALALAGENIGPAEVARQLGVTKNMVIGFFDRQGIKFREYQGPGTMERLQALWDMMDLVLTETRKRKSHTIIIRKQEAGAELRAIL